MTTATEEYVDPFEAHFRRDPVTTAGVRVIAIAGDDPARTRDIASGIAGLLADRGREAEIVVVVPHDGRAQALLRGLEGATLPLVLVTTAEEPWTAAHLDPLLRAIDACDHAVGRRRINPFKRLARRLAGLRWNILFAVPVVDVHSPCRVHRRESLRQISPQSTSSFLDVELLAKATFLGHLIDEVAVPDLGDHRAWGGWDDLREVFRHPLDSRAPT